nr:MAG TPA: putative tail component [Caudoviricetes sp.]
MRELEEYASVTTENVKKGTKKIAKKAVLELQANSPKNTGDYAKSWKSKITNETSHSITSTIYAGDGQYRLTHLLEKGHAKRGGGRVEGTPHIAPVEKMCRDQLMEEIKKL